MGGKYKYYFRKPKSEIIKDVFYWLTVAGAIYIAVSSPYFVLNLQRNFKTWRKYKNQKISNAFYRLRKEGCIIMKKNNRQIYISLTEKGKKKAGWLQIDALKIKKAKKWDKKWRLVIFDISETKKIYRESFRGKLKELGFYPLQKSIWAHPFNCEDEVKILREFFGLSDKELRLVVAEKIGEDKEIKKLFNLN